MPTPPSETSWAEVSMPSREPATRTAPSSSSRGRSTAGGDPRQGGAAELGGGIAEQQDGVAFGGEATRGAALHVVEDAHDTDDRGGQDRDAAGGVVEADIAAGDGESERAAAVSEPAAGL